VKATLIRLENVSKVYPRVHHPWERVRAFGSILLGREPRDGAEVLSGINLEVQKGQSLGVIGENGAGKSTLLKVLTGVIQPTTGSVEVNAAGTEGSQSPEDVIQPATEPDRFDDFRHLTGWDEFA